MIPHTMTGKYKPTEALSLEKNTFGLLINYREE